MYWSLKNKNFVYYPNPKNMRLVQIGNTGRVGRSLIEMKTNEGKKIIFKNHYQDFWLQKLI